jgi:hypothetical protein
MEKPFSRNGVHSRDGNTALCSLCGKLGDCEHMDVHHFNHDRHDNRLENLGPAHGNCNDRENGIWSAKERQAYVAQRKGLPSSVCEIIWDGGALTRYQATDDMDADNFNEGRKHEEMRARWEIWIHDLEHGIFRAIGATIRRQLLADKAVSGLSKDGQPYGSSVTYLRYIREDVAAGVFEQYKDGGVIFVRYLGPRKRAGTP